jgi:Tol biopolymer transport system component
MTGPAAGAVVALVVVAGAAPAWAGGGTERVSVGPVGRQADGPSGSPAISADGRFVAFSSEAANLVPGDTNGAEDVFVHDRRTGRTERVSVGRRGAEASGRSFDPAISADGRVVAFVSEAADLVLRDTNGERDIFVRDRRTDATTRVSVGPRDAQGAGFSLEPALSATGRYVAFWSTSTTLAPGGGSAQDIFVRDRATGRTMRVGIGRFDGASGRVVSEPAISAGGRFVAFPSESPGLVPGDTNGAEDVFVRDRRTGAVERVSVASDGGQADGTSRAVAISADGRVVAFGSFATNLVPGDANAKPDVFVHDRATGVTERVSIGSRGAEGNDESFLPALSANGRFVAFTSLATNLVPGDANATWDVFVHDRRTGRTERVSVGARGNEAGGGDLRQAAISADGGLVAFESAGAGLVRGDTNRAADVFVRRRR